MGPQYYWKPLATEHRAEQAQVNTRYQRWFEVFSRCHSQHSSDVQNEIKRVNTYVLSAIEFNTGYGTASTFDANQEHLSKELENFRSLLQAHPTGQSEFILVPDTNSLLKSADPTPYHSIVESRQFTFSLVPTVLSELDGLKRKREGQSVGEKADKAIRIIKGFRGQGSLGTGVTVSKTVTVKMIAAEPRMAKLPSWLDLNNQDDRILASALEIQFDNPFAIVILVTGDINLQNKAEMAFLPYAEPPEFPTPTGSS
jgi:PIN domain